MCSDYEFSETTLDRTASASFIIKSSYHADKLPQTKRDSSQSRIAVEQRPLIGRMTISIQQRLLTQSQNNYFNNL